MMLILCTFIILMIYLMLDEKKYKKYGVFISFFLILFLFAFRNNVGVDDGNYKLYFELIKAGNIDEFFRISGVEYSYFVICKLFSILNLNYKSVFMFYTLVGFSFLWLTLKKNKFNKNEYLILFLSFLSFSLIPFITVMRQFVAAAIGIYVIYDQKINTKNILLLVLAFLFHGSSIIFIPLFLISRIKIINKKIIYIFMPILAIILNYSGIFYSILKIILKGTSYYRYVINAQTTTFGGSGIVVITMFLVYLFNLVCFKNDLGNRNLKITLYLQMLFFSLYFLCNGLGVVCRLYYYFIILEPISLLLISKNLKKYKKLYFIGCICFLIFLVIYHAFVDLNRFSILNYSFNFWR